MLQRHNHSLSRERHRLIALSLLVLWAGASTSANAQADSSSSTLGPQRLQWIEQREQLLRRATALTPSAAPSKSLLGDPHGDTQGDHTHDITLISAVASLETLHLAFAFVDPVSPANSGTSDALYGFVDIDVDRSADTGMDFSYGFPFGSDFFLDLSTYDASSKSVEIYASESNELVGLAVVVFAGNAITIDVPLDALGGHDPLFFVAAKLGTSTGTTDQAPNNVPLQNTREWSVSRTTDGADGSCDADCSLREALSAANESPGRDRIVLGEGTYELERVIGSFVATLEVTEPVEIVGSGASRTFLRGNGLDRLITISTSGSPAESMWTGLTIENGDSTQDGGGLFVAADSSIVLSEVVLRQNESGRSGGAIGNRGNVFVFRSLFADNNAQDGGGVVNSGGFFAQNVTFSTNGGDPSAILNTGTVTLSSVTLVGAEACPNCRLVSNESIFGAASTLFSGSCENTADATLIHDATNIESPGDTCGLVADSDQVSVSEADLGLLPLGDNGGESATHALLPGSVARDTGGAGCPALDQRGFPRNDGACDTGALEAGVDAVCSPGSNVLCIDDTPDDRRFEVSIYYSSTLGGGIEGHATATPLSILGVGKGGIFSFEDPENPEVLVKVLDGCAVNDRFWVFYAATTTIGFSLTVEDKLSGARLDYHNPDRNPAETITDTNAFATCDTPGIVPPG